MGAEKEQQQFEQQQAAQGPPQPVAAPAQAQDRTTELKRLGELHTSGVLTDEEFTAAKAKILNI